MYTQKPMTDLTALDGNKLWDEILKAIVRTMPSQLFSLFKEVYGRDYPKDTSIILLSSETSSFQESDKASPSSTLMDIALLVGGTDYYHVECQMKNEQEMVIRMFAYDVQTYSLEEIHRKHLVLFIPYAILRLRPKLVRGRKHPLTEKN